jgi:hypothetical protein
MQDRLALKFEYSNPLSKMDQTSNFEITFADNVKQRLDDVKVILLSLKNLLLCFHVSNLILS